MDADEFRKHGKELVDLIANYWEGLPQRKPMPEILPGFMNALVFLYIHFNQCSFV
jgi:hypothetical protein